MKRVLLALSVAALAACTTTSPDVISRNDAQRLSSVTDATVLSVREVTVDGSQSGVGAAAGGVIGGLAGSARSSGRESAALGVIGAVVGGVIGNTVERATTQEAALEILVQLKSGERRSVVQAKGDEKLQAGDAVILVTTGGKVRVTKAPAVAAPRS
jgi:outer membrane lipoprotein SlyB